MAAEFLHCTVTFDSSATTKKKKGVNSLLSPHDVHNVKSYHHLSEKILLVELNTLILRQVRKYDHTTRSVCHLLLSTCQSSSCQTPHL